ncbi:poly-beta-1,6-N-acetyl-D-glucosamine biosynthesis protein PgaD [Pollutimonas harenae]|uniref:Poly-beta-1,6-N-acetyl-D-glucosamine biosynthesis protein PgaD n=1 Tax=Pollutimonas harenae TaxID=657015 RepID=A0A853GYX3_9BURK|nr:poly-beta-1,6-N-acetyl-D-glucosamine biosynthesis protein PgaD [Pollutimonas harenae]NYT85926.1 poly-beta-1,6-N-acetyl-D-glucosamine biosynthesis protein PgaD [Pollutimonas harenae]TEA70978.1 poly-beta-1,6-N-acetyl-D-glucosamine biosynthesis protein PgaD [Pollutimonas harenae]
MIITTQRSHTAWTIDTILTALGWTGFFFLFTRGVVSILDSHFGAGMPVTDPLLPTLETLLIYAIVACANAVLVVLWGKYRKHFFTTLRRNRLPNGIDDAVLASHFHLSCHQLHEIQGSRVTIIYHSSDGDIDHLDTDQLRVRPAGNNEVYEAPARVA